MSIELPVDIGPNALKYSTTERLQEIFVAIIEYLMSSDHSPDEWIDFLSKENHQIITSLSQITERLVELEIEEMDETNNKDTETETEIKSNENEESDDVNDFSHASPLSLLCQILVMFGSLNPSQFCSIIMQNAFENILSSIKCHSKLKRFDTLNRLKLIEFIAIHHQKIRIESNFIEHLCAMLNSEYNDVMQTACLCIIYLVARGQKSQIKSLLELIHKNLTSDHLTFFTEFYFETLNSSDYSGECIDDSLELLITFNSNIFAINNFNHFFPLSDIKILIDIYIRSLLHCSPSSKPCKLCLDGIYCLIQWRGYTQSDSLNLYKLDALKDAIDEILKLVQTAIDDAEEVNDDSLEFMKKCIKKMETIKLTLDKIQNGDFEYEANNECVVKLNVDISEYALTTKPLSVLQKDFLELLSDLSQSEYSTEEWITFLSENDFEIYNRLCFISQRFQKYEMLIFSEQNDENKDEEAEDEMDKDLLFPLSSLCQLLATFGSLDADNFAPLFKENAFKNVILSLSHHQKLGNEDVSIRLQAIIFLLSHNDEIFEYFDDNNDDFWFFGVFIDLLKNEFEPVLILATKCIIYYIAKLGKTNKQRQIGHLDYLQNKLQSDDFEHFTEHYFEIFNEANFDNDHIQSKLLIDFVICVFENNVSDFFFSSDLKVLIDVFVRTLHNMNIDGMAINWICSGIEALFRWNGYETKLERYGYEKLCDEIRACINNAIEHELFEVAGNLDLLLRILK